jgi:23S rRNA (guanosine2251-2'-O)-methyltransferase
LAKKRNYLYGKNSVHERLRVNPRSIRRVFIQDNFKDEDIMKLISDSAIPVKRVPERDLLKTKKADRLQGIVAEVEPFTYMDFDFLIREGLKHDLTILMLDGLNDPHNLGSIMRTAACFGGFALVIPEHGSCEVNDTVIHVSSGGENYVPVSRVTNLSGSIIKAKKQGYWIAGTLVEGGEDIRTVSLPFPLCLVLGSEGKGVRYGVKKHLDLRLTLPMKGAPLSLNVAMAGAIFCHEISRQKGNDRDKGYVIDFI